MARFLGIILWPILAVSVLGLKTLKNFRDDTVEVFVFSFLCYTPIAILSTIVLFGSISAALPTTLVFFALTLPVLLRTSSYNLIPGIYSLFFVAVTSSLGFTSSIHEGLNLLITIPLLLLFLASATAQHSYPKFAAALYRFNAPLSIASAFACTEAMVFIPKIYGVESILLIIIKCLLIIGVTVQVFKVDGVKWLPPQNFFQVAFVAFIFFVWTLTGDLMDENTSNFARHITGTMCSILFLTSLYAILRRYPTIGLSMHNIKSKVGSLLVLRFIVGVLQVALSGSSVIMIFDFMLLLSTMLAAIFLKYLHLPQKAQNFIVPVLLMWSFFMIKAWTWYLQDGHEPGGDEPGFVRFKLAILSIMFLSFVVRRPFSLNTFTTWRASMCLFSITHVVLHAITAFVHLSIEATYFMVAA